MDPLMTVGLMTLLLLILIAIGIPVAFSAGIVGSLGIVLLQDWATLLYTVGTFPVTRIAYFSWIVIPLFILMGHLVEISGVGADAYSLANKWLARLKGGLVLVTIGSCGMIAATTGSGATGTVIMGKIAVPEMKKHGYDMKLATGATCAAGTVGVLIPPSAPLVIIGVLWEMSIGELFVAGIFPGILSVLIYMAMVNIRCTINPRLAPPGEPSTWKEKIFSLYKAWGVVLIFATVMGGLYTGIATATEVATLGSFIALVLALLAIARGRANRGMLKGALIESTKLSAMIFALVIGAGIFSLFITLSGIIPQLVDYVSNLAIPRYLTLAMIISIYIPLGMFFDPMSMIMVLVPIMFPVVVHGLGFNPVWYAIITIKMGELGAITPPVGLGLFVMKGIYPEAKLEDIVRGASWFMLMDVLTVVILVAFPAIALWLPETMWN